jgi:hypothetical protein
MLSDILAGLSAVPLPNDLPPWETIYRRFQLPRRSWGRNHLHNASQIRGCRLDRLGRET